MNHPSLHCLKDRCAALAPRLYLLRVVVTECCSRLSNLCYCTAKEASPVMPAMLKGPITRAVMRITEASEMFPLKCYGHRAR